MALDDRDQTQGQRENSPSGTPAAPQRARLEGTASAQTAQSLLKIGEVFADRYEIERELGRGGFGVVYAAFDRGPLKRTVALKVIRFALTEPPEQGALARQRFLEEARVAGKLSHNNIATIFDVGESSGCVYMTQELAGSDLRRVLSESGPLALRRVIAIMRQICDGLAHAHAKSIVHRDIKPGNILVDAEDRIKITDFGLAQPPQGEDSTLDHLIAGTPGYMAPEQLRDERVDARADIFALGCILYQMLTGRPPFEGKTLASVIEKTLHSFPADPSRVREDLPRALDRIVARAMRKAPDERYDNITLLAQDLLNYEQFEYLTERKRGADEVAAALEARQCVLFVGLRLPVGSGESRSPTGDCLIADYLAERLGSPLQARSLPRLAQDLEMERGRAEMLRHLTAAARNPGVSPREIIRRVARLPFPVIVTTRYDTFLEEELTRVGRKVRRILDCRNVPDDVAEQDLLVRLFGSVESEESIVVTEDDLWNFFGTFHSLSDALKSLFARQSLLFVGYDPEDEGFRHLLSEIVRFRAGITGGCYLPATDISLPAVRWAQRKGLRLIDTEPGPFLSLLEETLTERRRQEKSPREPVSEARLPSRPYKFLNYYDVEDESIFFGRRIETQKLLSKIHAYPLNVLYAPSGSGKTSLICAGLIPQLQRDGYSPVCARVYDDPVGEIRRAALEATGTVATEFPSDLPLPALLPQLAARTGRRLVVFVDQFEEIFIRYDREARDRFATTLEATLAEAKGQVRFVLSLREDFLARLSEFRDRIPTIFHNEFRLAPLSEEASRAAIVEPARLLGLEVEPQLVERLIADLSREGIDPPQLQIVCDTLFDALESGEKRLRLKSYLALGETRKILTNYLERVLRELPSQERETAREVLKDLVTSEQTKTVSRISDLVRAVGRPEEEVSRILADLSNRRLIRRVQREEGFWYELTHEYLVEEIGRWLSEKEKELKKIRELLEQAVRNHRNLGILMPAAQIRLVMTHEDDLHLSKEERQLLRASEQALSSRRKTIAVAAAAAAVLLALGGLTWRYEFLKSRIFIQPQDSEFIEFISGSKQAHRLEGIRVYVGSPERWWIDGRLGFPKFLYQTDFELQQLDPSRRDAVKAGLMFHKSASVENEILKMLQPDEKVKFLITTGRIKEALELVPGLYKDPSIDKNNLDRFASFLGHSGVADERLIGHAVRHAFRIGSGGRDSRYLVAALDNLPEGSWRAYVSPFLKSAVTLGGALDLLGALGNQGDVSTVVPYLDDESAATFGASVRYYALRALINLGDCSALGKIWRLAVTPETDYVLARDVVAYISLCGDQTDLSILEQIARRQAAAVPGSVSWYQIVTSLYEMGGRSSIPVIRRVLALGPSPRSKLRPLETITDPEILPVLRSELGANVPEVRAEAAYVLAKQGHAEGLTTAASVVLDRGQQMYTRGAALDAFLWFRGPGLKHFLLGVFKTSQPEEAEIRANALRGLRWYDDDETLSILLEGLKDRDRSVRQAALASLTFQGSEHTRRWLHEKLGSLDPIARVYVARALQLMEGSNRADVFTDFLKRHADETKDYAAVAVAAVGLRDSYLDQPVSLALEALRDSRYEVRLAATLALVEHQDSAKAKELLEHAAKESDARVQIEALRAQWAGGVTRRSEALREAARAALVAGSARRAAEILNRAYRGGSPDYTLRGGGLDYTLRGGGLDYTLPLKMGLSARKSGGTGGAILMSADLEEFFSSYVFQELFSPSLTFALGSYFRSNSTSDPLELLADQEQRFESRCSVDVDLPSLQAVKISGRMPAVMFLRANRRFKDGKPHRYFSVVESRRLQSGRWCNDRCCIWARSTTTRKPLGGGA